MRKQTNGKTGGRQILGLKYFRLKAGLLQYHAAQAIGVHVSRLAKLERGILKPRSSELEALAKLYAVEAQSLTQPCTLC